MQFVTKGFDFCTFSFDCTLAKYFDGLSGGRIVFLLFGTNVFLDCLLLGSAKLTGLVIVGLVLTEVPAELIDRTEVVIEDSVVEMPDLFCFYKKRIKKFSI